MNTERKLFVVILRDQNNYKEWVRSTTLALKKMTLWEYVNDFKEKSQLIMFIDKNTLEQQNRMNARFEKRQKYFEQQDKAVGLIGSLCLKNVQQLQPLRPARIKSWNHTAAKNVRKTPIAVNIETKASVKSWTDGKPQLAIWTSALFKRFQKLVGDEATANLRIPAMPLVIAQGHDWHLIISHQPSPEGGRTVIWQKIDIGNTRNCFDIHKIIAVLHLVAQWAETTWRPWFHSLLDLAKMWYGYGLCDGPCVEEVFLAYRAEICVWTQSNCWLLTASSLRKAFINV